MTNGLIFAVTVFISLFFILLMLRFGKQGLTGLIVTNIILVSSFGALLIPLFGMTSNAGNVFYASIFLAAQVMTEHYGRKAAFRSIWVGFGALVLFVLLAQYSIRLEAVPGNTELITSLQNMFAAVPRVALASMAAYLVSQTLNVWLYDYLRQKTNKRSMWLRSLACSTAGQLVDSIFFFAIAFASVISNDQLIEAMAVGFAVKLLVGVLGIPVLYASSAVIKFSASNTTQESTGD